MAFGKKCVLIAWLQSEKCENHAKCVRVDRLVKVKWKKKTKTNKQKKTSKLVCGEAWAWDMQNIYFCE